MAEEKALQDHCHRPGADDDDDERVDIAGQKHAKDPVVLEKESHLDSEDGRRICEYCQPEELTSKQSEKIGLLVLKAAGERENIGAANLEICYKIGWADCPDVLSKSIFDHCFLVSLSFHVFPNAEVISDRLSRSPVPSKYNNTYKCQTVSSASCSIDGKRG